jgi:hypothetical protein
LKVGGNVDFTAISENVDHVETLDMRSGATNTVTINAADVLDFGGNTGTTWSGNAIDLVVRGDSGDTVNLNNDGAGHSFTLVASNQHFANFGGNGVNYSVYSDGNGQFVAVEDTTTVVHN